MNETSPEAAAPGLVAADCQRLVVAVVAAAAARPAFLEALTAIDWLVHCRDERNFGLLATVAANGRVHGALGTVSAAAAATTIAVSTIAAFVALRFSSGSAGWASLRLGVAALGIERLLAGSECECLAAIAACQCSVHGNLFSSIGAVETLHCKNVLGLLYSFSTLWPAHSFAFVLLLPVAERNTSAGKVIG